MDFILFFFKDSTCYSVTTDLDWLENYVFRSTEFITPDDFYEGYDDEDVEEIIKALDQDDEPYTLQEEIHFSGFVD